MSELKKCPFCGNTAKSHKTDVSPEYQTSLVRCTKCPAEVGKSGLDAEHYWNTRIDKEREAKLVAALRFYADKNNKWPNDGPWGVNSNDFGNIATTTLKDLGYNDTK